MNYTFNNIAGYRAEKEELERICEVIKNRDKYLEKGAKMPKGIIFYGEAGTGKTLFAKVLAEECGLNTYKINLANLESGVQICRKIRRAFEKAAKHKEPSMIFFDELDKLLPNGSEEYYTDQSKMVLAQLLTQIDGMDSSNNFIFVATCNGYGSLPETLVRPGRIDKKINIGKPNYESRVEILNFYASQSSCRFEISIEELAKRCSGFTCSALETLVNECIIQSDENNFASNDLISKRILEIKQEDIPRATSNISDSIDACRNIGNFVVARSFNNGNYMLNLESENTCNNFFNKILSEYNSDYENDDYYDDYDDDYDDYDEDEEKEDEKASDGENKYFSKTDLLNTITVLCGGFAAHRVIFNKVYDNMQRVLSNINSILFNMSSQGMFGIEFMYSAWRNEKLPYSPEFVARMNDLFEKTLLDCYRTAEKIIQSNKKLIEHLIPILVEKRSMDYLTCESILKDLADKA